MPALKPHYWWGVTYINGNDVMPDTIRRTRREAKSACCGLVGERDWDFWKKMGCRTVRVTVQVHMETAK